MSDTNMS